MSERVNGDGRGNIIRIPMFGLEIEKRTDVLALAAFTLAILGILIQVYAFLRGFDVRLFHPEQVLIVFQKYTDGREYMRVSARMSYVNLGRPGYNATIRRERVEFTLGGRDYVQYWQAFQSFDMEQAKLVTHYESDAHPFPVLAGNANSHETFFAPRPIQCRSGDADCKSEHNYLVANDFIRSLNGIGQLKFNFVADVFGGDLKPTSCIVNIDTNVILHLATNNWAAPSCWQPATNAHHVSGPNAARPRP